MLALSDSIVISGCSLAMLLPASACTSMISTSLKSPRSGSLISRAIAPAYESSGSALSASMRYFFAAFPTADAGRSPSAASASTAAWAMWARSTSKWLRRAWRLSDLPKPSVPRVV